MKILKVTITSFVAVWLSVNAYAQGQIILTGVLQQGTEANGQTAGSPILNTLGNETDFANLYVTQPNAGYTAPFLNSGNGSGASVSIALTPGNYQFYFFCMGFWDNNPGNYGLNLFFEGNNTNPGISAFTPANSVSASAVAAGLLTLSLNGDNGNPVPSPGSLTYVANGLSVTLTSYGFGQPGVFGGSALDRVGDRDSNPDSYPDSVGVFNLTVSSVPEPTSFQLMAGVFLILLALQSRNPLRRKLTGVQ